MIASISERRFNRLSGEQFQCSSIPFLLSHLKTLTIFYCTRLSPLWESYENGRPVFIWVTAKPLKLIITTSASLIMENEVMFQNAMEGCDSNCLFSIILEGMGWLLISLQTSLIVLMRKERKMNSKLLHKIRWHFGTGREPEELKEADSLLCLHWCGSISQKPIRALDFSLLILSCFSQWNLFSETRF